MAGQEVDAETLQHLRVRMREEVIYRSFASETVLLNLQKGMYHGLNAVAGDMFVALEESDTVLSAAERLASEYGQTIDTILDDLVVLVGALVQRELVEVSDPSA